jgi:hypothetical protein
MHMPASTPRKPQTPGVPPPPQVSGAVQLPQSRDPPQPSPAGPQLIPWLMQLLGMHAPPPHTLGLPPPPHVWGAVQVPQLSIPPQPSPTGPQFAPACAQVRRVHVGGGGMSG